MSLTPHEWLRTCVFLMRILLLADAVVGSGLITAYNNLISETNINLKVLPIDAHLIRHTVHWIRPLFKISHFNKIQIAMRLSKYIIV